MGDRLILRNPVSRSIALHALFLGACLLMVNQRVLSPPARPLTWIELEQPRAKPRTDEDTSPRAKIVQTHEAADAKVPAKDAFLGAKTQIVDRETVSRRHTTELGRAPEAKAQAQAEKRAASEPQPAGPLAKFGLQMLPDAKQVEQAQRDEPRWAAQGGSPEDYVKGTAESDRTLLNTKEYVFYGYFQRIRSRLDRAWVPILRTRLTALYKTGRQLASDMDHTTRVLVVLNSGGEVTAVKIQRESGTQDLDDAAIRAFNAAGPFPNPPNGIVDANNQIQIPWEFILKT